MEEEFKQYGALRVALSHDWLTGMRGGERVLEMLCGQFPQARLYTLLHNPSAVSAIINARVAATSWLQRLPRIERYYRYALPVLPQAMKSIRTQPADLLISTSHCVAKGLSVPPETRHLCYCFTPMRYAWVFYEEYFGRNKLKKAILSHILDHLRKWDYENAQKVTRFVAISRHIQERISKCYNRESDLVYPPVDIDRLRPAETEIGDYDLIVSALVPYKRVDLAVEAYNKLGRPVKIVGIGTEYSKLRQMAASNIELLGWQPDAVAEKLYQGCRMLVFPGEEDFGIVPIEAQACGRPVVAYAKGGALETVIDGQTGVHFEEQTVNSLISAIEKCAGSDWNASIIRANAENFGPRNFLTGLQRSIELTLA